MAAMIATQGNMVYAILFAIVFAETGLVLTPFLPGDSLLFAAGAFAGGLQMQSSMRVLAYLNGPHDELTTVLVIGNMHACTPHLRV